ncbi:hypothetical protein O4H66_20560 [Comamonadaceae bacterium G21597-S1]|nr:hypothetical protein [Comamonadaceae bacterium G21597-S1]
MSFEVFVSDDGKYIVGKVHAQLNRDLAQQLAKEYAKLIESTGIRLVLNDVRGAKNSMGILNEYEFAYRDVPSLGIPRNIRSAIVSDEGDTSHDFQETVARNSGYSVKVFRSMEQAVEWLLSVP